MDAMTALRVVVSLAVVFAAIWLIAKQARRRGAAAPGKAPAVRVLGKAGVAQKASVVVVETEGQRLVLGVTEHGVSVLHTTDAPGGQPQTALAEAPARTEDEEAPRGAIRTGLRTAGSGFGTTRDLTTTSAGVSPETATSGWNPRQRISFHAALLDEIRNLAAK